MRRSPTTVILTWLISHVDQARVLIDRIQSLGSGFLSDRCTKPRGARTLFQELLIRTSQEQELIPAYSIRSRGFRSARPSSPIRNIGGARSPSVPLGSPWNIERDDNFPKADDIRVVWRVWRRTFSMYRSFRRRQVGHRASIGTRDTQSYESAPRGEHHIDLGTLTSSPRMHAAPHEGPSPVDRLTRGQPEFRVDGKFVRGSAPNGPQGPVVNGVAAEVSDRGRRNRTCSTFEIDTANQTGTGRVKMPYCRAETAQSFACVQQTQRLPSHAMLRGLAAAVSLDEIKLRDASVGPETVPSPTSRLRC